MVLVLRRGHGASVPKNMAWIPSSAPRRITAETPKSEPPHTGGRLSARYSGKWQMLGSWPQPLICWTPCWRAGPLESCRCLPTKKQLPQSPRLSGPIARTTHSTASPNTSRHHERYQPSHRRRGRALRQPPIRIPSPGLRTHRDPRRPQPPPGGARLPQGRSRFRTSS